MNDYLLQQDCPNISCRTHNEQNFKNIAIHDKQKGRLRCNSCQKTWSVHYGKFFYGLHTPLIKVRRGIEMLKARMPIRKIAPLLHVSPGTVMRWKKKFHHLL